MALFTLLRRQPVGLPCLPFMRLRGTVLINNLHRAARQRDDYSRMFMRMHGQRSIWQHNGFPDAHGRVFELRNSLGLADLLWDQHVERGQSNRAEKYRSG